jgi:hypothetical protein
MPSDAAASFRVSEKRGTDSSGRAATLVKPRAPRPGQRDSGQESLDLVESLPRRVQCGPCVTVAGPGPPNLCLHEFAELDAGRRRAAQRLESLPGLVIDGDPRDPRARRPLNRRCQLAGLAFSASSSHLGYCIAPVNSTVVQWCARLLL